MGRSSYSNKEVITYSPYLFYWTGSCRMITHDQCDQVVWVKNIPHLSHSDQSGAISKIAQNLA